MLWKCFNKILQSYDPIHLHLRYGPLIAPKDLTFVTSASAWLNPYYEPKLWMAWISATLLPIPHGQNLFCCCPKMFNSHQSPILQVTSFLVELFGIYQATWASEPVEIPPSQDLTQPWVQELIFKEVQPGRISAVHLGPPCGTSKARCIPVKRKLLKSGAPNPKPLRSPKFPLGFPWLKGISRAKVQAANCLYQFSAELVEMCDRHDIPFTVENPANSLLWLTPFLKPLVQRLFYHVVDACEYGSEHKKTTGFLANFNAPRLQQRC